MVLPSGKRSRVRAIDSADGERAEAFTPESVTLRLEDEIDCSRGDMIVHPHNRPRVGRSFEAHVVWLHERALDPHKSYWLKHTTRMVRMQVDAVRCRVDLATLAEQPAETLALNDIGRVAITCHQPLYFDPYKKNRATGSFVIVDSLSNNTVGAGMILEAAAVQPADDGADPAARTQVSPRERAEKLGHAGLTLLLHGASAERLRVVAFALERRLFDLGRVAHVLFAGEGAPSALAWAARACTDAGLVTICVAADEAAAEVRARVGDARVRDGAVGGSDEGVERAVERLLSLLG
jgi:bifunctional enzyme CysN/CysC